MCSVCRGEVCYITLDGDGTDLKVEFILVPYDVERATAAINASEMPHEYAPMLLAGKG